MARPLRIEYNGAWYHIMNRGLAHQPIFYNDGHRHIFIELLFEVHNRYQAEIHAYCLMDNHYHLLIRTPLGNISRIMQHLDGLYTQRFNRSVKRDGPLFRGRYKSILVEADVYLLRLSRYIHLNPVKAKLVKKAEHFKWSSYQSYFSEDKPYWLTTECTLNYFGNGMQKQKYKTFIEEGVDAEINQFYKKIKNIPILGTDAFTKTVTEKYLKEQHKIDDIPEHKILIDSNHVTIENIISCIAKFYHICASEIYAKKRGSRIPRIVAMYLAHTVGQHHLSQISLHFTDVTVSGVSRACKCLQELIRKNSELRFEVENIRHIVMEMSNVKI